MGLLNLLTLQQQWILREQHGQREVLQQAQLLVIRLVKHLKLRLLQ